MIKRYVSILLLVACFMSLHAVWKWEQYPNPLGADVNFTFPNWLADDWQCGETGGIATICFAYSWMNDVPASIVSVHARIYADIPDPDGAGPLFSMPGQLLWDYTTAPHLTSDSLGMQDWYDPITQTLLNDNHLHYYKNQIDVPTVLQFQQTQGSIYWLALSIELAPQETAMIGWKTSGQLRLDEKLYLVNETWTPVPLTAVPDRGFAFKVSASPDDECPVELSSFTAIAPTAGKVQIQWVSQSETDLSGYLVYRSSTPDLDAATMCLPCMMEGTNTTSEQTYRFDDMEVEPSSSYWYWLESVDRDGSIAIFGPVNVMTAAPDQPLTPIVLPTLLSGNQPNPFSHSMNTTIRYSLSKAMNTNISIYNLKGQLVRTLTNSEMTAGAHDVVWNGKNDQGQSVSTGVYFYRMQTSEYSSTRKLILMK